MKKLTIILLIFLVGCVRIQKYGYSFEHYDPKSIEPGVTSKERVERAMGSPTIVSDFGPKENSRENSGEAWIYYSDEVREFLFLKPKIVKREILEVRFGDDEVVSELANYDLSNKINIKFDPHYTYVPTHNQNWFTEIFSNIGSVRP